MVIQKQTDYSPLALRYDQDNTVWVYVKWVADAAAKTGKLLVRGQTGWEAKDPFDPAASQVAGTCLVGFPEKAQTTNTYGWAQVGGPISDAIVGTSTSTAGHQVIWKDAKLQTSGLAGTTLSQTGAFGIYTSATASGTTHDIMLFPYLINGQT